MGCYEVKVIASFTVRYYVFHTQTNCRILEMEGVNFGTLKKDKSGTKKWVTKCVSIFILTVN